MLEIGKRIALRAQNGSGLASKKHKSSQGLGPGDMAIAKRNVIPVN